MSNKHFLAGITLGAVIGAGLAYMFGTEQGKKLQKDIKKTGKELAKNIPQDLEDFKAIKDSVSEKSSDLVENLGDQAKETLDAVKDTVSEATDSIKEHFNQEESPRPKPRFFKKSNN